MNITWREDPNQYEYLRLSRWHSIDKRIAPGRIIGYTQRDEDGARLVWWLKPYDRGEPEDEGIYANHMPAEAVTPPFGAGQEPW